MSTQIGNDLLNLKPNSDFSNPIDEVSVPSNIAQKIDTMSKFQNRVKTVTNEQTGPIYIEAAVTPKTISFSEFSTIDKNNQVGFILTKEYLTEPSQTGKDLFPIPAQYTNNWIPNPGYNKGLLDYLRLAQDNLILRPTQIANDGPTNQDYYNYHNIIPGIFSPSGKYIDTIMDAGPHNVFEVGNLLTGYANYDGKQMKTDHFKIELSQDMKTWKTLYTSPDALYEKYLHQMNGRARYVRIKTLTAWDPIPSILGSGIIFGVIDGAEQDDFSTGPGSYHGTNAWNIKVVPGEREVLLNQADYGVIFTEGLNPDSEDIGTVIADQDYFENNPSTTDNNRIVKRINPDITGGLDSAEFYRDSQIHPIIGGSQCANQTPDPTNKVIMVLDAGRHSKFKSDFLTTGYHEKAGVKYGTTPFSVYKSDDNISWEFVYESLETTVLKKTHSASFEGSRFVKIIIHSDMVNNIVPTMYFNVQIDNLNLFGWKPWNIEIYYDKISFEVAKNILRLGTETGNILDIIECSQLQKSIKDRNTSRQALSTSTDVRILESNAGEEYIEVLDAGPKAKFDFTVFNMITGFQAGPELKTSPFMIYGTDDESLITKAQEAKTSRTLDTTGLRLIYSNGVYLNNVAIHQPSDSHRPYRFMVIKIPVPDPALNGDNIGRIVLFDSEPTKPFRKFLNLGVKSYQLIVKNNNEKEIVLTDESIHFLERKLNEDILIPRGQNGICIELDTNGYNVTIEEGSVLVAL